jgi:hypothetical protein
MASAGAIKSCCLPSGAECVGHAIANVVYSLIFTISVIRGWILRDRGNIFDNVAAFGQCENREFKTGACFRKEAVLRVSDFSGLPDCPCHRRNVQPVGGVLRIYIYAAHFHVLAALP